MATTYVKTPEGVWVAKGGQGDVAITDPVTLRDLSTGAIPSTPGTFNIPQVNAPEKTTVSDGTSSLPIPQPIASPYTVFNKNLATILGDIQSRQSAGSANLGGAIDTLKTESVAPNGPTSADPGVFSGSTVAGQETLQKGFDPAITSINTQLQNTNTGLGLLSSNIKDLAQIYAPQAVAPGMSLVTPDGKVIKQGHQYTPTLNTTTGLMDGFDTSTGTWSSQDMKMGGDSTPVISITPGSAIVGGIDFGTTSTGIKPYATDPGYADSVNTMYNSLKASESQTGGMATSAGIDAYIKAHSGSSPVTGQMIFNAAAQYQLDPNMLAAVLGHESGFGTSGAAVKTMNPGNVGNTDNGSTQTFKSWQQGVNAAAQEIARRKVTPTTSTDGTSKVGGEFSDAASKKVSQLPSYMQSYVDAGPKGVAYINDDRVPANAKDAVKTIASRTGIPYVQASDASALKSISVVYKSLDQMQELANSNLSSGVLGHAKDTILGTGAQIAQTDWGNNLSLFNSYRDTAIKAVQALAGGAGSGLRINGAEIMANMSNLAGAGDSKEHATKLIGQMRTLLDNQLQATFPYIKGSDTPSTDFSVTAPNGKTYTFPDQSSLSAFKTKAGI